MRNRRFGDLSRLTGFEPVAKSGVGRKRSVFDVREGRSYEAVIVGGGPAGINGAVTAANLGHTVAIVDSQPSSAEPVPIRVLFRARPLRETALSGMHSRKLYGVGLSLRRDG